MSVHMKPEKMLKCQLCDFVTEHKQQFQSHVDNLRKLKLFKCEKCTYACVSKSMLKSHIVTVEQSADMSEIWRR